MKKLILTVVCALGCSALLAEADTDSFLYWMVGDSINAMGTPVSGSDLANYKVRLIAVDQAGNKYLNLYGDLSDLETTAKSVTAADATGPVGLYAGVGDLDPSMSIFMELLNSKDKDNVKFAGIANLGTVASLSQYIASMSGMSDPVAAAKSVSSFVIPEPTSGLLMLFGCAALALRRRKMIKA